jgi:hypothetical protein
MFRTRKARVVLPNIMELPQPDCVSAFNSSSVINLDPAAASYVDINQLQQQLDGCSAQLCDMRSASRLSGVGATSSNNFNHNPILKRHKSALHLNRDKHTEFQNSGNLILMLHIQAKLFLFL